MVMILQIIKISLLITQMIALLGGLNNTTIHIGTIHTSSTNGSNAGTFKNTINLSSGSLTIDAIDGIVEKIQSLFLVKLLLLEQSE